MKASSFFKHAGVYGLCSLLVHAGGLILLPLYTRVLDPKAYGILEILGRLAETVSMCLIFGGLRQALLTFYRQSESEEDRRRIVSGTYGLLVLICVLGGGLAMLMAPTLAGWIQRLINRPGVEVPASLLRLAFLTVLFEPFSLVAVALMQARLWSGRFLLVSLGQLLLRLTLCVVLVVGLGWGVLGVVLGTSITSVFFALVLSGRELLRGIRWPCLRQLREMVVFAIPFLPGSICFFLLHQGDRFLLMQHGPEEVGLYGLGYRLAQMVGAFSLTPLCQVWYAQLYSVARTPEAPTIFGRAFTRILAGYVLAGLGLALFLRESVLILAGSAYLRAADVVLPVLLACACQAMASLMDAGFYVRRRTGLKLAVTMVSAAVMLGLYFWLIPRYQAWGAALATLGGFAFLALATFVVSRSIFEVHYEWGRLAGLAGLSLAIWLMAFPLPAALWAAPLKLGIWLLAPLLAWQTGLISPDEKEYVHSLACQLYRRFQGYLPKLASSPLESRPALLPEESRALFPLQGRHDDPHPVPQRPTTDPFSPSHSTSSSRDIDVLR